MSSPLPAGVAFQPRDERFDLAAVLATDWDGGDPVRTAFWNALSSLFPLGETFFIDAVRPFVGRIADERLRRDVRAFMGQEAVHSREHRRYNNALCAGRGINLDELEAHVRAQDEKTRANVPPIGQLAITVAYEHFTAMLAHQILTQPHWTSGMPEEMRRLWVWHSIEEAEHKAVAFDVFMAVGGDRKVLRKALYYVSKQFAGYVYRNAMLLLRDSGLSRPVAAARLTAQIARMMWATRREFADFFRADFHPWKHDNRAALARALDLYGAAAHGAA